MEANLGRNQNNSEIVQVPEKIKNLFPDYDVTSYFDDSKSYVEDPELVGKELLIGSGYRIAQLCLR